MGQTLQIFVSHISEEARIAALLKEALEKDFVGFVELFASSDAVSIKASEDWLVSIRSAMEQSAAVIVLCSKASVQRPWVQFEIGAAWLQKVPIIPVCHSGLRLTDLKMPLSRFHGLELGTPGGLERLYDKLADLLEMKKSPEFRDRPGLLAGIKAFEAEYEHMQLQQFERYIDIIIEPEQLKEGKIADAAVIESDPATLHLLDFVSGARCTWQDIVEAAKRCKDSRWIDQLQQCIELAARDKWFRPVQAIYHTRHGSFQPQLARKEHLPTGATSFHVHLIETVVAPLFDVPNEVGTLATLLRLGLRFRYEVIEKFRKLQQACEDAVPAEVTPETLGELRNAIEVIEIDAQSRGAQNIDVNDVAGLFHNVADRKKMFQLDNEWNAARALVFRSDRAPTSSELCEAMRRMRALNITFMTIGTARFNELVRTRWDSEGPETLAA